MTHYQANFHVHKILSIKNQFHVKGEIFLLKTTSLRLVENSLHLDFQSIQTKDKSPPNLL